MAKKVAKVKKVKLEEYTEQFVPAYPTADNKFHKQGRTLSLHPDVAKHLESKGLITTEEPEDWVEIEDKSLDAEQEAAEQEGEKK